MAERQNKFNKLHYDQVNIRFPLGTLQRFKDLFPGCSFNGWVSNLVTSRILIKEWMYPNDPLPDGEEPPKEVDEN